MDFELRHTFPHDPQAVWEELLTEAYEAASNAQGDLDRQVLGVEERDGERIKRTRITSRKELPGFMAKAIGASRLSYDLEERYPASGRVMHWTVRPLVVPDKVDCSGTFEVREVPGGCERLVKGRISVNIRFIGSKIEDAIGAELRASYARSADFAEKWLAQRLS